MMNGFDSIEEAVDDLKRGRPIIVCDDENRENEGDLVLLAEHATPEMPAGLTLPGLFMPSG